MASLDDSLSPRRRTRSSKVPRPPSALAVLLDGQRCDACVAKAGAIRPDKACRAVAVWVRRGTVARAQGTCPRCGATRLVSRVVFGHVRRARPHGNGTGRWGTPGALRAPKHRGPRRTYSDNRGASVGDRR